MDILRERRDLKSLLGRVPRSPQQVNGLFESDVEILRRPGEYLTSSTDSIGEEISQGFYRQPYLWGWMTVMSSVSDLAASGSEALGLLLSTQWAFNSSDSLKREVQRGIRAALSAADVPLLGGDSGYAKDHVLTSTILGRSAHRPLLRLGVRPGDRVFLLGRRIAGAGPAFAFRHLAGAPEKVFSERLFRPRPDWRTMHRHRRLFSASIDTSDGVAASLAILGSLNKVAFRLNWNRDAFHPMALRACQLLGLPAPLLWMGDHGDFQALVTASPAHAASLSRLPEFIEIGEAVPAREGFSLIADHRQWEIPVHWITECARDLGALRGVIKKLTRHFIDF